MEVIVPVFLSKRKELVKVEIQLRTVAMDFWASLEHDLAYKLSGQITGEMVIVYYHHIICPASAAAFGLMPLPEMLS